MGKWGIAAALALLVGCANEGVLSVPACTCSEHPTFGRVCEAEACDPAASACERPDGSFCARTLASCE